MSNTFRRILISFLLLSTGMINLTATTVPTKRGPGKAKNIAVEINTEIKADQQQETLPENDGYPHPDSAAIEVLRENNNSNKPTLSSSKPVRGSEIKTVDLLQELLDRGIPSGQIRGSDRKGIPLLCANEEDSIFQNDAGQSMVNAELPNGTRSWECIPGVIRNDGRESFRLEVNTNGAVSSVTFDRTSPFLISPESAPFQLRDDGQGEDRIAGDFVFTSGLFRYNTSTNLPQYYQNNSSSPSGLHSDSVGQISITDIGGIATKFLIGPQVGFLRSDISATSIVSLSPEISSSPHLINVRTSSGETQRYLRLAGGEMRNLTTPIYRHFPDSFDFFMFFSTYKIEQTPTLASSNFNAGLHSNIQVNYSGTGLSNFDRSASFGSSGKLLGINILDSYGRGISGSNATHELLHQWASHIDPSLGLADGTGHNIGRSSVGSLVGGFEWSSNQDGSFTIICDEGQNRAKHASLLDKYMMGLIGSTQVPTFRAYSESSTTPVTKCNNGENILPEEIIVEVSIDEIQGIHGIRTPGPEEAKRDFHIGFVAESRNRVLNSTEMTFYEILAQHFTKILPGDVADPAMDFGWQPITRYFAEGTTWHSDIPASGGVGSLQVSSDTIDYAEVVLGENQIKDLTVTNNGLSEINITSMIITGSDSSKFRVDSTPFSLPAGESRVISVGFTPDEVRRFSANMIIESNGGSAEIMLLGSGINNSILPADAVFTGEAEGDLLGISMASAGDVNNDGFDDVIVGANRNDAGGGSAGRAYLFHGPVRGPFLASAANAIFTGEDSGDRFGTSVSTAGDVNKDGFDDVIVGAHLNDIDGSNAGRAYLFFGPMIGELQANDANVIFSGENPGDLFGNSVSSGGDVNQDGFDDILIGARGNDTGGDKAGRTYLFYGPLNGKIASSSASAIITGEAEGDEFGTAISSANDINNDGFDDILVGAKECSAGGSNAGRAYAFYGPLTGEVDASAADAIITGEAAGDELGISVSSVGDANGDGFFDIIIGAAENDAGGTNSGRAYLFYGPISGEISPATANAIITGEGKTDRLGSTVSSAGDFNKDGLDDILVGAPFNDIAGGNRGRAYLFFGPLDGLVSASDADSIFSGELSEDLFGRAVATAGDVNNDGASDILIGASRNDTGGPDTGRAYLYSGSRGTQTPELSVKPSKINFVDVSLGETVQEVLVFTNLGPVELNVTSILLIGSDREKFSIDSTPFSLNPSESKTVTLAFTSSVLGDCTATIEIQSNGGNTTIPLFGEGVDAEARIAGEAPGDFFGISASSAGDVNNDGFDDVIVGASKNNAAGSNAGRAYLFLGPIRDSLSAATANTIFTGEEAEDRFGNSVSPAGDVNKDGFADILIGAPRNNAGGDEAGRAYIFYGPITGELKAADADVIFTGEEAGDRFGGALASAADINSDGFNDVIIGASRNAAGGDQAGRAYLFYGPVSGLTTAASADAIFTGEGKKNEFGTAVSSAGDVNNDGFGDIIVGATDNSSGAVDGGRAYLFFGPVNGEIAASAAGAIITGETSNEELGNSVSSAGDVNGDGYSDVIVGASKYSEGNTESGRAYLFYGPVSGDRRVSTADAIFTTNGEIDRLGFSVSSAGDFNDDGLSDIVLGAPFSQIDGINKGRAFLFYGPTKGILSVSDADISFSGESSGDFFGRIVAVAGDVNNDDVSDIIIGANLNDDGGTNAGRAYLHFGNGGSPDPELSISPLSVRFSEVAVGKTGQETVVITNTGSADLNITSIILSGVDSDRFNVDSTPFSLASGVHRTVDIAFFPGEIREFNALLEIESNGGNSAIPLSGTGSLQLGIDADGRLLGEAAGDVFGISVASAGDVNNDGFDDMIVGASKNDTGGDSAGRAYLFHGPIRGPLSASAANAVFTGEDAGDRFGGSVSGAGDINNDGFHDILVGARRNDAGGNNAGRAYLFYGPLSGEIQASDANVIFTGEKSGDLLGRSASIAGDVNKDGFDDILVGANRNDAGGNKAGRAYLFYGPLEGKIAASAAGAIITGEAEGNEFGVSTSPAGDINSDGFADIIVGATDGSADKSDAGRAYVFYGPLTGQLDASIADAIITGEVANDEFGIVVSSARDINGDGLSDLIIGAAKNDAGGTDSGRAYLFYGPVSGKISASSANAIITGEGISDKLGSAISSAGDFNGDGLDDILVGAPLNDLNGSNRGAAYLFFGPLDGLLSAADANLVFVGDSSGDSFGRSVAVIGDENNDDFIDIIIGATLNDVSGPSSGQAYIFLGRNSKGTTPTAIGNVVTLTEDEAIYAPVLANNASLGEVVNPKEVSTVPLRYVASFDGIDDRIIWGDLGLNKTAALSKFIRFRTQDISGVLFDTEFGSNASCGLFIGAGKLRLWCTFQNSGVQVIDIASDQFATDGKWHSAGFTYDGLVLTAYFDGVVSGSAVPITNDLILHNFPTICGGRTLADSMFYQGALADFVVYNVGISELDVLNYHYGEERIKGLVLWGKMDEGDYSRGLVDSSGNEHSGISTGAISITDPETQLQTFNRAVASNDSRTQGHHLNPAFLDEFGIAYPAAGTQDEMVRRPFMAGKMPPLNNPPKAEDDAVEISEGESVTINLIENDTDGDGAIIPGTVQVVKPKYVGTFDGIEDKVIWGNLGLNKTAMLSKFIRFRTTDSTGVLFDTEFGAGPDGGLSIGAGKLRLRCTFAASGVQTIELVDDEVAADGKWHSAGFTYNGSTLVAYFDGVVAGTSIQVPGDTILHDYPSTCGGRLYSDSIFFAGELSEFVVYDFGIPQSDVFNYHTGKIRTKDLVLWGKMDESNYATGLTDFSNSRHMGTSFGASAILDPEVSQNPINGSIINHGDGTITYTPNPHFIGEDSFEYTVEDDRASISNNGTVTIHINPKSFVFANDIIDNSPDTSKPTLTSFGMSGSHAPEVLLSRTVYEDAEDGTIDGWTLYGEGEVANIPDLSGNRIISTHTKISSDPFRLGLADHHDWNNTVEFTAYFAILMEEEAAVYFRVDTSDGEKYLCYMSGPQTVSVNNNVVLLGLGIEADGQWHPIYRHLANDLEISLPGVELISIKDFYVFGSVKLDNVMLIRANEDQK